MPSPPVPEGKISPMSSYLPPLLRRGEPGGRCQDQRLGGATTLDSAVKEAAATWRLEEPPIDELPENSIEFGDLPATFDCQRALLLLNAFKLFFLHHHSQQLVPTALIVVPSSDPQSGP